MPKNSQLNQQILDRLDTLEAEKLVAKCMHKYMFLCDQLGVDSDLNDLAKLFSETATWQGKGQRYAKTFGCYEGRNEIIEMFARYTQKPAHFQMNAHFLCNEMIDVKLSDATAAGRWLLIQPSTFSSGKSQLSCAYISAEFLCENEQWLISSFTTENIFSRLMVEPWDNSLALHVPEY